MVLHFNHSEFETEVRKRANVLDRAVTEKDALSVTRLDLSNFDFLAEDVDTLSLFKNLKVLDINIGHTQPSFWHNFAHIEELCVVCWGSSFNFQSFERMRNLSSLTVSGGDYSNIDFLNLDALIPLKKLRFLELHEFGSVDLLPLTSMSQLKELELRYSEKIIHLDAIGELSWLEYLALDGLYVDNLDFLDRLPSHLKLEMCGNHVYDGVDPVKWKRFAECDVCEISVKDKPFVYIDLSALNR